LTFSGAFTSHFQFIHSSIMHPILSKSAAVILLGGALMTQTLFAQKNSADPQKESHPIDHREAQMMRDVQQSAPLNDARSIHAFVSQLLQLESHNTLVLLDAQESPLGHHYLFAQHLHNQPVYYAQVRVNTDKEGYITSILENTYPSHLAQRTSFQMQKPLDAFKAANDGAHIEKAEQTWLFDGNVLQPALMVRFHIANGGAFERLFDENGRLLYVHDLHRYHHACNHQTEIDTTVQVWVFNPDPVTEANTVYGAPYVHANNQNTAVLDPLRVQRSTTADFAGGIFHLRNAYVRVDDFDAPNLPVVTSTTPAFNFSRNQAGFEQTNCFYHVTTFQEHLQRIGFNIAQFQIRVDGNGVQGADNAYFTPSPTPRMSFGPGGVPDGEDADVIYHEYTHALFHSAAPGTGIGNERRCLEEAHADYFATSFSKSIKVHNADRMFSWDGHNEFWGGRWATNRQNKNYNSLTFSSNIYTHTDIWVASVMEVWDRLGRDCTDQIATQAMYGAVANMTMRQFALLMLDAHRMCSNPAVAYNDIHVGLSRWGILPNNISTEDVNSSIPKIALYNTTGFANGEALRLEFVQTTHGNIQIVDAMGRAHFQTTISAADSFEYAGLELPAGVYFLQFSDNSGAVETFKLIRY
jgi:hypothetical protein